MSGPTTITGDCPIIPRCLSWSNDGMLAVAHREHIDVFIPLLGKTKPADENVSPGEFSDWDRVRFQINLWTVDELPGVRITASSVLSLGEEQSNSYAVAIDWSLPGLAKHARSALAVLTSNLRLSIWAPSGNPRDASSWKRVLLLNTVFDKLFPVPRSEDVPEGWVDYDDDARLRRRIRQYTWSTPTRDVKAGGKSNTQYYDRNQHLIVIANDKNHVVFVRIKHETAVDFSSVWSFDILNTFSIEPDQARDVSQYPSRFDFVCQDQRYPLELALSPWYAMPERDALEATLAFYTATHLCFRRVNLIKDQDGATMVKVSPVDVLQNPADVRPGFPLCWLPRAADDTQICLLCFSMDSVTCLQIQLDNASDIVLAKTDLGGRWDLVCGVAFGRRKSGQASLNFSSALSTTDDQTMQLSIPLRTDQKLDRHAWQEQVREMQALHSAEHDMDGFVCTRVWGLTSSPLGDLVAACFSFHPSDVPEYSILNFKEYVLSVNTVEENGGNFHLPQTNVLQWVEDLSSEAIAYSMRRWFNKRNDVEQIDEFREELINGALQAFGLAGTSEDSNSTLPPDDLSAPHLLKAHIFLDREMTRRRLKTLIDIVCHPNKIPTSQRMALAERFLTISNSGILQADARSDLGSKISAVHLAALQRLQQRNGPVAADEGSTPKEQCDLCESEIKFNNIAIAFCDRGHRFVRCGLTFLAIQAPGISKSCGLCGTRFLDESKVLRDAASMQKGSDVLDESMEEDQDRSEAQSDQTIHGRQYPPLPFERLLFEACDVCIYCGGRYVQ